MQVHATQRRLGFTLCGHLYTFSPLDGAKEAPEALLSLRAFQDARDAGELEVFGLPVAEEPVEQEQPVQKPAKARPSRLAKEQ